jgi:uncharacterized protein YndB with AHSA1/START domain
MRKVEASITIDKPPSLVMSVFTEFKHLRNWWNVERALIDLRKGGVYALVWGISSQGMNYVSTGIIGEYQHECQLRIDQWLYLNPQRPILGPMELLIMTTPENGKTVLTIVQRGYQQGEDWNWYYEAVKQAWPELITVIKDYAERQ